jgi:hypothetical protein
MSQPTSILPSDVDPKKLDDLIVFLIVRCLIKATLILLTQCGKVVALREYGA